MTESFYRTYLKDELVRRTESNPRYSLRAFAKALQIDPTGLSKILSAKKPLSLKTAQKVMSRLPMNTDTRTVFLNSVVQEQQKRSLQRMRKDVLHFEKKQIRELDGAVFRVISDWYHYAILELCQTKGFQSDARWIAKNLGIAVMEAKMAVDRLLSVGLIENKNGRIVKTNKIVTTGDIMKTSPAHIKHQIQILNKAKYSVENDPIEERSSTGMTMAIEESKLPIAKQLIDEFMDSLCQFLESGNQERVYQLSVSLFPLQKKIENKNVTLDNDPDATSGSPPSNPNERRLQ